jgi:hypothetical protein
MLAISLGKLASTTRSGLSSAGIIGEDVLMR